MNIAVIGGGASGMMAAITAANQGAQVTLFEKNDRIGKKILLTGNGKCNLTNLFQESSCYHSNHLEKAEMVLNEFPVTSTLLFFETLGLVMKNKDGYIYPNSDQASTVLDLLRMELKYLRVTIVTDSAIRSIKPNKGGFLIEQQKQQLQFDKVILATGSKANPQTGSDGSGYAIAEKLGHTIISPQPALVQLRCKEDFFKAIAGVRLNARCSLIINQKTAQIEEGELQITDYGISGIPVFQFSGLCARALSEKKSVTVELDLLPEFTEEDLNKFAETRLLCQSYKSIEEFFVGLLNKKLLLLIIKKVGLKISDDIMEQNRNQIFEAFYLMKHFTVTVIDTNSFQNAQVCSGGVSLEQLTPQLESKVHPGLYFAGELLDVDGRCGGYNLQWAWASGYTAGYHSVMQQKNQ